MAKKGATKVETKTEVLSELEAKRPTQDQIKEWKERYGAYGPLYKLKAKHPKTGEEYFAIVRTPKMVDMEGASKESKKSPLSSVKYIVRNCSLYMDDEINKNDNLFLAICAEAEGTIQIVESSLEEL